MLVETFSEGDVVMSFNGSDGTILNMHTKGHFIDLEFIDKDGYEFTFKSDGEEFTIPGLVIDITGNKLVASGAETDDSASSSFSRRRMAESSSSQSTSSHSSSSGSTVSDTKIKNPPGTYSMEDFAKYTKNSDDQATIKLDSLGITLNLNYIDVSGKKRFQKKDAESHGGDGGSEPPCTEYYCITPEWNYDLHGADWPDLYPNCAKSHQSPINLLDYETEYGQSYNIYKFEDDNVVPTYWDLEYAKVLFDLSKYTIDVYIDHNHGYAGFESDMGSELFDSVSKWDAYEFVIHSPSDHTINGVRYDMEVQIYHKAHPEEEVVEGEGGEATVSEHRRMAASAAPDAEGEEGEESGGGHGDTIDLTNPLYIEQENPSFDYAGISILFSVNDYDEVE